MKFVDLILRGNPIAIFFIFFRDRKRTTVRNFIEYYRFKFNLLPRDKKQKTKLKKVIFLLSPEKGAGNLRGYHISEELQKRGISSEVQIGTLSGDIEGSFIIFVKYFPYKEVMLAARKNCRIIYDIVDYYTPLMLEADGKICDGVIFSNYLMVKHYNKFLHPDSKSFVIYHHWDPRIEPSSAKKPRDLSIAYFGDAPDQNALYHGQIPGLQVFRKFKDHIKHKNDYNCLYSVRKKGSYQFLFKPSTKTSTAAGIGANIITTREPSAVDLLGEDYPYLTDDDSNSVINTFKRVEKSFNKKEWKDAMKIMKKVKKRTSLKRITDDYIDMIYSYYKRPNSL